MTPTDRRAALAALAADAAAVIVFVVIGRRNHDESSAIRGVAATAVPFLIGLAVAWLATRAWKRPTRVLTGVAIWPITVLVGMIVRRAVFDRGTATAFVIVATLFLGACFVGWRATRAAAARRRTLATPRP